VYIYIYIIEGQIHEIILLKIKFKYNFIY